MHSISNADFVLRLLVALGLGAGIGFERQMRRHEAGLKTNALVASGSAMFVLMASFVAEPDRVIAQILPGIGFLGAGMIMRDGVHVRGLNTAATMWCSAAIGTLTAIGHISLAVVGAAVIVAANIILRAVAQWVDQKQGCDPADSQ